MALARTRNHRTWVVLAFLFSGLLTGVGLSPAVAEVSSVTGSAYGYFSNVALLGAPAATRGPAPTVTLPSGGSGSPITDTAPSGDVRYGPARLLTSGTLNVSTQGTTGTGGSVTSAAFVAQVGPGPFTADSAESTCRASESGVTGSTTLANGSLVTNQDADGNALATVTLPANPAPNTTHEGTISVGDTFRYVFNEQIRNADGTLTVNAAHMYLLGPSATGDLIIGQSVCGVRTGTATPTTAGGATTTTPPAATTAAPTTSAPAAVTTTAPSSPTTAPGGGTTTAVGGGAYGYFANLALLGAPAASRGPAPTVSLPAGGSASPVTASAPSGEVKFGPATLFTSERLEVSTQGTPAAGGSVTSSATVQNTNRSGQGMAPASSISSRCTASATGQSGSTRLADARLTLSQGADENSEADDTVVQLPAEPAPNTPYEGKVESVGDTFRVVVNEQQRGAGSITVNAVHVYLLGPTATGELIIAQSRCSLTASSAAAAGGGGAGSAAGAGRQMPATGAGATQGAALALHLVTAGWTAMTWAGRRRTARRPRDPFARRWL